MIFYGIDSQKLDAQTANSWNEFWVDIFYEEKDLKGNITAEANFYKELEHILINKKIEILKDASGNEREFSYCIDMSRPKDDYMGILEVGTKVRINHEGDLYEGTYVGDSKLTMDDVAKYFGD